MSTETMLLDSSYKLYIYNIFLLYKYLQKRLINLTVQAVFKLFRIIKFFKQEENGLELAHDFIYYPSGILYYQADLHHNVSYFGPFLAAFGSV